MSKNTLKGVLGWAHPSTIERFYIHDYNSNYSLAGKVNGLSFCELNSKGVTRVGLSELVWEGVE